MATVTPVPFIRPGTKKQPTASALPTLRAKTPSGRFLEFCKRFLVHVKGEKTGHPLVLAKWQVDSIVKPLFNTGANTKRVSHLSPTGDNRRRYRVCYLNCPRKQGKSTLGAAIALYLLYCDGEGGAEIVSAASSADQAAIIYDTAKSMVERAPALRAMTMVYRRELVVPSLGARYKVISAEAGTAHGLNLSGLVIDELHVWPQRDLYDALMTSTGARQQPLVFIATTAGDDEHSICAEVHRHAEQVRDGIVEDPTLLPVIYAAPDEADWQDEAVWKRCNPALGTFRSLEEMRSAARQAKDVPGREASFRRLYLNQWGTAAALRWLSLDAWDACADRHPAGDAPRRAFLGLDLSTTTDLTALVILVPRDEMQPRLSQVAKTTSSFPEHAESDVDAGNSAESPTVRTPNRSTPFGYEIRAEFFCPADYIAERSRRDRVPYQLWREQGFLTATQGNVVDYTFIEARIHALMRELEVVEVAVDPWNARGLIAKLQQDGVPAIEVPQTMANLTSASKELEKLILSRRLHHDGHPILRWCISNAVADVDGNGNVKPSKKHSHERIDGVSALVTALARALISAGPSVYESRAPILVDL